MKKTILSLAIATACVASTQALALSPRIIGGAETRPGAYPWMVSLHAKDGGHFCGASLIGDSWVLTAAHCVEQESANGLEAVVGEYDQSVPDQGEQTRAIKRIVVHPKRGQGEDFDIALLELASPVDNPSVTPIDRALSSSLAAGTPLTVMGWGNLSTTGQSFPDRLYQVQVPLVSQAECKAAYNGDITDNMLCAGLPEGGKDACQGDSGGPLLLQRDGQWLQVGIVSWGDGCAQPNSPGVYARVAAFTDWISEVKGDGGNGQDSGDGNGDNGDGSLPGGGDDAHSFDLPQWLDFFSSDQEAVEESLTLTNDSQNPVAIAGSSIDGDGFEVVSNDCEAAVAPGESCQLTVRYTPGGNAFDSAYLDLVISDGGEVSIALYGENLVSLDNSDDDDVSWWSGDGEWVSENDQDSDFTLYSGDVPEGENATLEAHFEGPGSLEFDFWLEGDDEQNRLGYYVDDMAVRSLKGGQRHVGRHRTELSPGPHKVTWVYQKKAASSGLAKISGVRFQRGVAGESANQTPQPPTTGGGSNGPLALLGLLGLATLRKRSKAR